MSKHVNLILSIVLFSVATSYAGEGESKTESKGRELLTRCAQKINQVHMVRYEADYKGTAWVAERVPKVKGKVVLGGRSEWDTDEFWCDVELKLHDSDEMISLTAGSDGDMFYLIDPKLKKVYVDIDPAVLGKQGRNLRRVIMRELTSKQPFKEIFDDYKIELQGTEIIAGEACDKIEVIGDGDNRAFWMISQKDHLPRRIIRFHNHPEHGVGTTELSLSHVEINPKMDRTPFTVIVPAGFTKTDDFAP